MASIKTPHPPKWSSIKDGSPYAKGWFRCRKDNIWGHPNPQYLTRYCLANGVPLDEVIFIKKGNGGRYRCPLCNTQVTGRKNPQSKTRQAGAKAAEAV